MMNELILTVMVMMMMKQIHSDHDDDVASVHDNQTNIGYDD